MSQLILSRRGNERRNGTRDSQGKLHQESLWIQPSQSKLENQILAVSRAIANAIMGTLREREEKATAKMSLMNGIGNTDTL